MTRLIPPAKLPDFGICLGDRQRRRLGRRPISQARPADRPTSRLRRHGNRHILGKQNRRSASGWSVSGYKCKAPRL